MIDPNHTWIWMIWTVLQVCFFHQSSHCLETTKSDDLGRPNPHLRLEDLLRLNMCVSFGGGPRTSNVSIGVLRL